VQNGELDPDRLSPPVPAGLTKLSASLTSLVEFLRIDKVLVRASAKVAAKTRTVADLMRELEAGSRKQQRVAADEAMGMMSHSRRAARKSARSRRGRVVVGT
jgi:hypothetical protein